MGPELLALQFGFNYQAAKANAADLSQAESLACATAGGNCVNWVLGHVVSTRNGILKLLGRDPIWDKERAKPYSRGSQGLAAEDALPLEEIMADYRASQKTILTALGEMTDEDLEAKSPIEFFRGDEETIGTALASFAFHEAYHVGQTGTLRRVAGKAGAIA